MSFQVSLTGDANTTYEINKISFNNLSATNASFGIFTATIFNPIAVTCDDLNTSTGTFKSINTSTINIQDFYGKTMNVSRITSTKLTLNEFFPDTLTIQDTGDYHIFYSNGKPINFGVGTTSSTVEILDASHVKFNSNISQSSPYKFDVNTINAVNLSSANTLGIYASITDISSNTALLRTINSSTINVSVLNADNFTLPESFTINELTLQELNSSLINCSTQNLRLLNTSLINCSTGYIKTLNTSVNNCITENLQTLNTSVINCSTENIQTLNSSVINCSTGYLKTLNTSIINCSTQNLQTLNTSVINNTTINTTNISASVINSSVYIQSSVVKGGRAEITTNTVYADYASFSHYANNDGTKYAVLQNQAGETRLNAAANQDLHFSINDDEKMTIKSDGKVGIGMTNVSYNLDVSGKLHIYEQTGTDPATLKEGSITLEHANDNGISSIVFKNRNNPNDYAFIEYLDNDNLIPFTNDGLLRIATIGDTEDYISIIASGSVGIGRDAESSTYKVDISGATRIYEPQGTIASSSKGTITLEHNNLNGRSSIVFKNRNNANDYGFIEYFDTDSAIPFTNDGLLRIGVVGDAEDYVSILASGSIGIGRDAESATYKVDISGSTRIYEPIGTAASGSKGTITLQHGDTDGNGKSSIVFASNHNYPYDYAFIEYKDTEDTSIHNSLLTIGSRNGGTDDIAIVPGGKLSIGHTDPEYKVDISGITRIYEAQGSEPSATSGTLILEHGDGNGRSCIIFPSATNYGSDYGYIEYRDDRDFVSGQERASLIIGTKNDGDDHVILAPSGNVGIGTREPTHKMHVAGASYAYDFIAPNYYAGTGGGAGSSGCIQVVSYGTGQQQDGAAFRATNNINHIINFTNTDGVLRGKIKGDDANSISYQTTSDRRLKKNVVDMSPMLDKIKEMKPVEYTWISDETKGYGFIAQDIYKIFPQMRPTISSYTKCSCNHGKCPNCPLTEEEHENPCECDASGNETKPYYYSLDYGKFTPYIVKALQELNEKVETLNVRIMDLEKENDILLARIDELENVDEVIVH